MRGESFHNIIVCCSEVGIGRYEKNGAPYSERVTPLNDIALVTLHRAVTSRSATPICLPERTRVFPDGQGVVAGWGQVTRSKGKASTELLYAEIDVFNATHCTQKYSDVSKQQIHEPNIRDQ